MSPTILCPKCQTRIEITEAMSTQLEEQVQRAVERERQKLLAEAKKKASAELGSVSKPVILPIGDCNNTEVVANATARTDG
jgi:uncharacterized Zn finger protein (UPF0148 family)